MSQTPIPKRINQWLAAYHLGNLSPAWIQLEKGAELVQSVGGAWACYFDNKPAMKADISKGLRT